MRTHLLPVMLQTYQQLSALSCAAPQLQLGQLLLSGQVLASVTEILSSNYWLLPGFVAAATSTHSSSGRFSPASALGVATTRGSFSSPSCSGGSFADGYLFTGGAAVQLSVQLLENLLGAAAIKAGPSTAGRLAAAMGDDGKGMRTSCSADCLCALNRSEGGPACRIGNPKCGIDGWCCCGSPKACSDITSPTAPPTCNSNMGLAVPHSTLGFSSTSGDVGPQTQPQWQPSQQPAAQLLLVTSALLQSRLLPELQRAVQQLGGSAEAMIEGSLGSKGSWSRPASATGLTVNVPSRRGSLQKDARVSGCSGELSWGTLGILLLLLSALMSCSGARSAILVGSLSLSSRTCTRVRCCVPDHVCVPAHASCVHTTGRQPDWCEPQGIQPAGPQCSSHSHSTIHQPAQPDFCYAVLPVSLHG